MVCVLRVLLDADLALLYGVPTRTQNQVVRHNKSQFPDDFCFGISATDKSEVVAICDHLRRFKHSRVRQFAQRAGIAGGGHVCGLAGGEEGRRCVSASCLISSCLRPIDN